jgi:uncharacterized repeat protein (TIGR03803 family)
MRNLQKYLLAAAMLWATPTYCSSLFAKEQAEASRPKLITLYSFKGGADGYNPGAGLVSDPSGTLYGTTQDQGAYGYGTVFQLTPPALTGGAWTETVRYSFVGGSDAQTPYAALVIDKNGAFYGTTANGGASGYGTVFQVTPPALAGGSWTETVLYSFGPGIDGRSPYGALVFGKNGALYGTTYFGGVSNKGTVFQLSPPASAGGTWTENVLYSFLDGSDGANPWAALVFGKNGALYGTTYFGGVSNKGAVFQLSPPASAGGTWTENVLYSFLDGSDGANPVAALVFGEDSSLYGTTTSGGSSNGGIVFKLSPPTIAGGTWTETVLYSFESRARGSKSTLVVGNNGALYGTTEFGGTGRGCGPGGCGTVFTLKPPVAGDLWAEYVLHNFRRADGSNPQGGLLFGSNGVFYGTTSQWGAGVAGTVFQLTL